ncbi:MAG TPA: hypothetical protein VFC09_02655 [Candidatus Dormibacteraeota bacterium]|nr:hypothetical protein [Candidatus Dormibacteraeota bacterium]
MAVNPEQYDEPQGVVWAPWRVQVRDRIVRDEEDLARAAQASREAHPTDNAVAALALASARRHARLATASTRMSTREHLERLTLAMLTGAPIESAWLAIHRAEEAMLLLMDDDAVRREVAQLRRAFDQLGMAKDDPRCVTYTAVLSTVAASKPGTVVADSDRNALREIRQLVDARSDQVHAQRRALRNIQLAVAGMCGVLALFLGLADHFWTSGLNLQPIAPNSGSGTPGVGEVLLIAGLGGLLSAIVALRNLDPYGGPFGLSVVQAVLKVPAGAVTGYVGVLIMQRGLLGVVGPQDGARVLGYAALFGFAQLAVTRLIDDRANKVLAETKAAQDPATTPGATPAPSTP